MEGFMTLHYRHVYTVEKLMNWSLTHSIDDKCLDNDRYINAVKNILRLGHQALAVGISVL